MISLRPYQRIAVDAAWNFLRAREGNPCIVLPTGSGKSHVMAAMIHEALTTWPGTRVLVLAHVRELVEQNADKLHKHWPDAPLGIYAASLKRRDRFNPVLFASIQSVYNKSMQIGRFDLILIDEGHRIPLHEEGQYRQLIAEQTALNPGLRIVGLTATPYRLGGGPVCGPDYILNEIACDVPVADLIRDGYLCRLISKGSATRVNLASVHQRRGEYIARELEAAVNVQAVVEAACDEIVAYCAERKAWLVFCAGIHHAQSVTAALRARGIACAQVDGQTPAKERHRSIEDFHRGALRALVTVNVLSEGFDAPQVDAICMLRPTLSAGLYYQQVGRGLRLHPEKENCLVLDFAGNIVEHGPIDAIRPPRKPGERTDNSAPVRECPKCHAIVPVQTRTCPECGYEFPREVSAPHDVQASNAAILSGEGAVEAWHDVTGVYYTAHTGKSGVPTLQVTYACGLRTFREWVCLEHYGMPRARAAQWWLQRSGESLAPRSVEAAMSATSSLSKPNRIRVLHTRPFPTLIGYDFDAHAQNENRRAALPARA